MLTNGCFGYESHKVDAVAEDKYDDALESFK